MASSCQPLSMSARRSRCGSTWKSSRPSACLIATSQRLAALNHTCEPASSRRRRAFLDSFCGWPAAHNRGGCRLKVSRANAELALDLVLAHAIEIVRHSDLAYEEAKAARHGRIASIERDDLDQRLSGLGDDEPFAFGGSIH